MPPGPADIAQIDHQVILDVSASVGGIDPASTGCLVALQGANPVPRLAVGSGQVCYAARGLTIT